MRLMTLAAVLLVSASPAMAAGKHKGGHAEVQGGGHGHATMSVGKPGKASKVSRTISVTMAETEDGGMIFKPASIHVAPGETIKFSLRNIGELAHEFVLDDHHGIMKHKKMMEMAEDAHGHGSGNSLQLEAGQTGELVWSFTGAGKFEFACLIPGHYEAGMKGQLTVSTN